MPTTYNSKRTALLRSRSNFKTEKFTCYPEKKIPVVINDKLTVYISDESKRQETIEKYKSLNNLQNNTNYKK